MSQEHITNLSINAEKIHAMLEILSHNQSDFDWLIQHQPCRFIFDTMMELKTSYETGQAPSRYIRELCINAAKNGHLSLFIMVSHKASVLDPHGNKMRDWCAAIAKELIQCLSTCHDGKGLLKCAIQEFVKLGIQHNKHPKTYSSLVHLFEYMRVEVVEKHSQLVAQELFKYKLTPKHLEFILSLVKNPDDYQSLIENCADMTIDLDLFWSDPRLKTGTLIKILRLFINCRHFHNQNSRSPTSTSSVSIVILSYIKINQTSLSTVLLCFYLHFEYQLSQTMHLSQLVYKVFEFVLLICQYALKYLDYYFTSLIKILSDDSDSKLVEVFDLVVGLFPSSKYSETNIQENKHSHLGYIDTSLLTSTTPATYSSPDRYTPRGPGYITPFSQFTNDA